MLLLQESGKTKAKIVPEGPQHLILTLKIKNWKQFSSDIRGSWTKKNQGFLQIPELSSKSNGNDPYDGVLSPISTEAVRDDKHLSRSLSCWPALDRARRSDMARSTTILQDARSLAVAFHPCRYPISDRFRFP